MYKKEVPLWKSLSPLVKSAYSSFLIVFHLLSKVSFSSLVHKTRQTYSSLKYFLTTFSGVCVLFLFCHPLLVLRRKDYRKKMDTFDHKKRRPRVKINQRRIHFEKVQVIIV